MNSSLYEVPWLTSNDSVLAEKAGMLRNYGSVKKYQNGGPAISARAAERKSAKGKGFTSYKMGTKDAPGSEGNKGTYVPFTRAGRKDAKETGMAGQGDKIKRTV